MSAVLASLQRASRTVVVVHAVKTAMALLVVGQLGLELARDARSGDLIALATRAMQVAPRQAVFAQWAVCGYALLAPLLLQWLLATLAGRSSGIAWGRYLRAMALSLARYAALAAVAAGSFFTAAGLAARVPPALELAASTVPLVAGLALVAWIATAHDVAQASLARSPSPELWRALRQGAIASTARLFALHAALSLAGFALFALGEALARTLPWPLVSLALTQALALGATFLGSAWLAVALTAIGQPLPASPYESS